MLVRRHLDPAAGPGRGVLDDVGDRLLQDAGGRAAHGGGHRLEVARDDHLRLEAQVPQARREGRDHVLQAADGQAGARDVPGVLALVLVAQQPQHHPQLVQGRARGVLHGLEDLVQLADVPGAAPAHGLHRDEGELVGDDVVQIAGQGLPLVLPEPLVEDLEVPHSLLAAAALLGEVAHGPSDEGHDEQRNEQIPEDASVEPSLAERRGRHDPGEVDGKVDFDEAVRRRGQDRHRHHGRRDDRRPVVVQYH